MSRHRFALAFLFLVGAVLFLPALAKQEVFTTRDHFDYFQPLRFFTAEELRAGRLPFWNPYSASGEPWLANPQTGVFYPPSWLFLALPFPTAYMLFLLAHLVILGWGAYLLFSRTASPGAAMVGATAVMFCGPTLSLLDVNNNLATLAWIPLALWCAAEGAWRRGALVLALAFLGGEPFFAAVAAFMYAIVALHQKKVRGLVLTAISAIGLSAIQLFPFLESLPGTDRASMSATDVLRDSMPLRDWLRIAVPPSLDASAFDPKLGQHFIPVVYVGMAVVALAIAGLLSIRKREVLGWLALLAVSVVVAAGPALLVRLPLTLFRYPARLVPLGALAIAGLAVAGWDRLRPNRRWLDLVLVLVVVADLLPRVRPLLQSAKWSRDVVPYAKSIGADSKIVRVTDKVPADRAAWISGYLNLYDRRFDAYTAAPFASDRYVKFYREMLEKPSPQPLVFLPAGYILTAIPLAPPHQLIARRADARIYRDPVAWPMARQVSGTKIVPATWEMTTSRAVVRVESDVDGTVVLAQQDAPGWRVTVDGKEHEKMLFDGLFRAVSVSKGKHEIVWTYRPRTFFLGVVMTLVTLLALQISYVVKRSDARKNFLPVTRISSSRISLLQHHT